ncbi:hypothetical protein MCOR25_008559 [Pyricularia grisea]|uniref:Uncharacterized protein n=1 Tax=Pyricularia grisea TaxID=148305 RepID=A0A6P8AVJ1_PYRGI|nr:uncharacterized protein PgNI_08306 [Pyricularia grisea]KAI6354532.1 hypothetical protein MCOR25_008559 [Pyricularia grisea]TLD06217.1 hypothetical protein PgNI_08306 [Pyricularia grisea]
MQFGNALITLVALYANMADAGVTASQAKTAKPQEMCVLSLTLDGKTLRSEFVEPGQVYPAVFQLHGRAIWIKLEDDCTLTRLGPFSEFHEPPPYKLTSVKASSLPPGFQPFQLKMTLEELEILEAQALSTMHFKQVCHLTILVALQAHTVAGADVEPPGASVKPTEAARRRVFKIDGEEFTPLETDCLIRIFKNKKTVHALFVPPGTELDWRLDHNHYAVGIKHNCDIIIGWKPSSWRIEGDKVSSLADGFSVVTTKSTD